MPQILNEIVEVVEVVKAVKLTDPLRNTLLRYIFDYLHHLDDLFQNLRLRVENGGVIDLLTDPLRNTLLRDIFDCLHHLDDLDDLVQDLRHWHVVNPVVRAV